MQFLKKPNHSSSHSTHDAVLSANPPTANSAWKKLQRPLSIMSYSQDLSDSLIKENPRSASRTSCVSDIDRDVFSSNTSGTSPTKRSFFSRRKKSAASPAENASSIPTTNAHTSNTSMRKLNKRASMPLEGHAPGRTVQPKLSSQSIKVARKNTSSGQTLDLGHVSNRRSPSLALGSDTASAVRQCAALQAEASTTTTAVMARPTCTNPNYNNRFSVFIAHELSHLDTSFELLDISHPRTSPSTASTSNSLELVSPAASTETFESAGYSVISAVTEAKSSAPSSLLDPAEDYCSSAVDQHYQLYSHNGSGKRQPQRCVGVVWVGDEVPLYCGFEKDSAESAWEVEDEELYVNDLCYSRLRPRMLKLAV